MLFNSYIFLFGFLPAFLLAWQAVPVTFRESTRVRALVFLLFSLLFYSFWGVSFLILFLILISCNYIWGCAIASAPTNTGYDPPSRRPNLPTRKKLLVTAIIFNLLPLLWFKYSWFLISNLALLLHADLRFTPPDLPLGISFYTFIQIAWLVGIYRGEFSPDGLERHLLFSSCFAYVISGPIVRYDQLGWQLDKLGGETADSLAKGFSLFSMGLAKKVILADSIGFYADAIFNAAEKGWPMSGAEAWLGSLCYTFQLYFDFSGYTDMALGLGLMIGLKLPENFNSPYKSTGIVEFWRRWHITLSSWLRDFLYIPLGGNRRGKPRQYLNLFLTMLIGGAWHGAGWTYIIWGALHGLMLGINHFFRAQIRNAGWDKFFQPLIVRVLFILITFFCLNFCWVVFRALSLDGALAIYTAMFTWPSIPATHSGIMGALFPNNYLNGWQPHALVCICAGLCWFFPNSHEIIQGGKDSRASLLGWRPDKKWAIGLGCLVFVCLALLSRQSTFLYFQF